MPNEPGQRNHHCDCVWVNMPRKQRTLLHWALIAVHRLSRDWQSCPHRARRPASPAISSPWACRKMLRKACTSSAKCALPRWCSKSARPASSSARSPWAIGPSSSMARCTPAGVWAFRKDSASSYFPRFSICWNCAHLELARSPDRCREASSNDCPAPSRPGLSSASSGATKRGVTPSCAVGRKKGALARGFGGAMALLRSLTRSKCSVANHFCGGTSDNVSRSGARGTALTAAASTAPPASSPSSSPSSPSTASSGAPGSSMRMGSRGSGRRSGAESEGSKRNLFAQTCMALPLACDVIMNAELGEKQTLSAGLAKTKESTHLAARRSKIRKPPSRRAAASQRPSPLKATSAAGTPQVKERTTAAPLRSTTRSAPSSSDTATREPKARSRRPLGAPGRPSPSGTDTRGSCVANFQTRN
mmetsp:Transcript_72/g.194  ORF Transcript_72/g.194 Transcript_72/m.194 type:complete len:419 (-) Transcript_72:82-1338(-)